MNELYTNMMIRKKVFLRPNEIRKDYQDELVSKLKREVESRCIKEGYVREGSVNMVKRSIGMLDKINSNIVFDVIFSADICNPMNNTDIKCTVKTITEIFIIATAHPMMIQIPKEIHSNRDLFNNIKKGDQLEIKVIGKKIELNGKVIKVIGKLTNDIEKHIKLSRKPKVKKKVETEIILEKESDNNDEEDIEKTIDSDDEDDKPTETIQMTGEDDLEDDEENFEELEDEEDIEDED